MDNEKLRIENCQLGDLCQISPSRKPIGDDETVTFIGMEDVSGDGKIINHNLLPYSKTKNGLTYFEKNDVLVAKITPCFENGKGACLDNLKTEKGFGSTEFHILRVNNNSVPRYIFYHTQSEKFRRKLAVEMVGSAGQKRVSASAILNYQLSIVHSISEQTAIAAALNDADALITQLEKLIAKKRNIKQGAMQELLRPKEGWEVKQLKDIAQFTNGKAHEQFIDDNGDYIVVNSKFISTEGEVYKNSNVALSPLNKGDIAMVMSDIPNGKALAKCFLVKQNDKYTLNQRICSIKSEECNNDFLYWILNRNKYFLAFDSGTGQTNLKKQEVLECPIPLSPTIEEQENIAQILSDMDEEIEALEKKLEKYKMLKQGMMQNLLTGKIRLV